MESSPPLVLVQKDSKWSLLGDAKEISSDKAAELLDKISGNRIRDFLKDADVPKGEASGLRVTLGDDKVEKKRQLAFWKIEDKLYARDLTSPRKEAFLVDSTIRDALPWSRAFFDKSAPPAAHPPAPSAGDNKMVAPPLPVLKR